MYRYHGLNVVFFCMCWVIYCEAEELTILPVTVKNPILQLSQHLNHLTQKENEVKQPKILLPRLKIVQPKLLQPKLLHVISEQAISGKNGEVRQSDIPERIKLLTETVQSKVILPESVQLKREELNQSKVILSKEVPLHKEVLNQGKRVVSHKKEVLDKGSKVILNNKVAQKKEILQRTETVEENVEDIKTDNVEKVIASKEVLTHKEEILNQGKGVFSHKKEVLNQGSKVISNNEVSEKKKKLQRTEIVGKNVEDKEKDNVEDKEIDNVEQTTDSAADEGRGREENIEKNFISKEVLLHKQEILNQGKEIIVPKDEENEDTESEEDKQGVEDEENEDTSEVEKAVSKKKKKHLTGTVEAMRLKKPYSIMTCSNIITILILQQLEPFNLFLQKRKFYRLLGKSDNVNQHQSASWPLADIYNLINLTISSIHLIRVAIVNIDWPSSPWKCYEILGLLIFNTSIIFRLMAISGPILWNALLYHTDLFRSLCDDEYEEVFSNNISIGLSITTLCLLSLLTPWLITHIIPMMVLYFWILISMCGFLLVYLKIRREWIDRRKGNQIYNKCIFYLDKWVFGSGSRVIRKVIFQLLITTGLQLFLNYGVLFYGGIPDEYKGHGYYLGVCRADWFPRTLKDYVAGLNLNIHRKLEMVTMML